MPKLIIKRETPQRFTRQTILFWLLGLLPVAVLAGFLTGNLVSQLRQSSLKSGQPPVLPLAPILPSTRLPNNPLSTLPLALPPERTSEPFSTQAQALKSIESISDSPSKPSKPSSFSKPAAQTAEKNNSTRSIKKSTVTSKIPPPSNKGINNTNTKDQKNNRSRPTGTPSPRHKPVKSPQTVSQSSHPPRPATSPNTESKANPLAKAQAATPAESRDNDDYRLLEQSLGIPLQ